ncbi:MAG TPA: hypothetical protein VGG53_17455 [Mycobacterium sp.]|jgi:hypothetical protein|uniref:hypothetical protein n=1 Tax=Mycobacterium sp. TaxID=1785 RepID=UPI002F4165AC
MKRPLAGALFAAGALSLSALGAAGAAQAETVQPGNVTVAPGPNSNQFTITCPHPDDNTLNAAATVTTGSQITSGANTSYTQMTDISSIDAFATDTKAVLPYSTFTPNLTVAGNAVESVEIQLYSDVTDAITKAKMIYDGILFHNSTHEFHFNVNKNHVSYGTMIVHWSKAGVAQDDEVLACSFPNTSTHNGTPTPPAGNEAQPGTGPQFG